MGVAEAGALSCADPKTETKQRSAVTGITITNATVGGGGAHAIVQPTMVCNYIIRII